MSGPESKFWVELRDVMKYLWDAQRHEDQDVGVPDISYCMERGHDGWIELKCLSAWPKRRTTVVRLPHFTAEQRLWLLKRGKMGSAVFVFLKTPPIYEGTNKHYLLFGRDTIRHLGHMMKKEMTAEALYSSPALDPIELSLILRQEIS